MKLIGSNTSPYVRKVRMVLAEKRIEHEYVLEDVWSEATKLGRLNPVAKVPTLLTADGQAIFDSSVIVEYLERVAPEPALFAAYGSEAFLAARIWEAMIDGALDAALLARMEATWAPRGESGRSQAWIDRQLGKVEAIVASIAERLGDRAWSIGDSFGIADIGTACLLGYLDLRFPTLAWRDHANLDRWYASIATRPSFATTRPA